MLELFKFIFSSFWVWCGTLLLVGAVGSGFAAEFEKGKSWLQKVLGT